MERDLDSPDHVNKRRWKPDVDTVAWTLSIALGFAVILLGLAVVINVIEQNNPAATLGENTTQVLTSVVGGLVGILGSYIGFKAGSSKNGGSSS